MGPHPHEVHARRLAILRRRLVSERARHTIAVALYESVVDGLELGHPDVAAQADREWLNDEIAMPLQESVDLALDALVVRVARLLDRAPNGLGDRFDRSQDLDASERG